MSTGIAIVNKESFKKFPDPGRDPDPGTVDPDRDPDCHQTLIDWSFGHAPTARKIHKTPFITF